MEKPEQRKQYAKQSDPCHILFAVSVHIIGCPQPHITNQNGCKLSCNSTVRVQQHPKAYKNVWMTLKAS